MNSPLRKCEIVLFLSNTHSSNRYIFLKTLCAGVIAGFALLTCAFSCLVPCESFTSWDDVNTVWLAPIILTSGQPQTNSCVKYNTLLIPTSRYYQYSQNRLYTLKQKQASSFCDLLCNIHATCWSSRICCYANLKLPSEDDKYDAYRFIYLLAVPGHALLCLIPVKWNRKKREGAHVSNMLNFTMLVGIHV
jgi:hypothetical protein